MADPLSFTLKFTFKSASGDTITTRVSNAKTSPPRRRRPKTKAALGITLSSEPSGYTQTRRSFASGSL